MAGLFGWGAVRFRIEDYKTLKFLNRKAPRNVENLAGIFPQIERRAASNAKDLAALTVHEIKCSGSDGAEFP